MISARTRAALAAAHKALMAMIARTADLGMRALAAMRPTNATYGTNTTPAQRSRAAGNPSRPSSGPAAAIMSAAVAPLSDVRMDAAILLHQEGRPEAEVRAFLADAGLLTEERVAQTMAFLTHPLWRYYVATYAEGGRLDYIIDSYPRQTLTRGRCALF